MSVIGHVSADGTAQVHCPRPGCSAVLKVKPRTARTWVTCAADGCGHRFVLDIPDLTAGPAPAPPPLPAKPKDTFAVRPDDPRPEPSRPPRPRRKRAGAENTPGSGKTVALVAGGAVAVLLLGAGLVFGLVWVFRDTAAGTPAGPVVQSPGTQAGPVAPAFHPNDLQPKSDPVPKSPGPKAKAPAPVELGLFPRADLGEDEPDEVRQPRPKKGPRKIEPKNVVVTGDAAIAKVKRSTALIERKDGGSGSGFVIKSGLVMTNFHVISGSPLDDLKVSFVSLDDTAPTPIKPTLLYCNPERDIAILRVDTDRPPLEVCPTETRLEGLAVAVVGNPTDGVKGQVTVNKVTTGHLAAPIRRNAEWTYYELRAEARPGNSGGPVVDASTGKLVGVMQSIAIGKGPERSYCIPFGEAQKALDRLPASREQEPAALKVAAARHYLDYFKKELPVMENMARNGMLLQINILRAKALGGGARAEVVDRRTGQVLSAAEVMSQLKEEYARSLAVMQKALDGPIKASPEVPSALASKARLRLETCGSMRSLASGETKTETAFQQAIDNRTAANEKAARAFEDEYKKFLDAQDRPKGK